MRPKPLLVSAPVLFLETEILLVLGGGAPSFSKDLGGPALLRVERIPRTTLVTTLVLCVPQTPRPPHLQVLPGDVHPDEISLGAVPEELLVDGFGRLAGGLLILEPPKGQQLAFVWLGMEDALLATSNPVLFRMFS